MNQYYNELLNMRDEARNKGKKTLRVVARVLHAKVRRHPPHQMPSACNALWKLWREQGCDEKRIIHQTPSGYSSTLEIEFTL